MKHLERCPEQEMLSLLSCAQLTFMIDSQMVELHNEQVAYFSQKRSVAPDDPSVLGKELNDVFLSWFINDSFFLNRAFYLDQSNMPASSAPKAALIDKVRIALRLAVCGWHHRWRQHIPLCSQAIDLIKY